MLKKIFRPKWENNNPMVRKEALQLLDPTINEENAVLLRLAKADPDESVRKSAINQLKDLNVLNQLMEQADEGNAAKIFERTVALVSGQAPGLDETQQRKALENGSQQILFEVAKHTQNPELRELAITQLTDQECLLSLVIESNASQIRQLAVAGIIEPEVLKSVINRLNNKDKRVLQMARSKLNQLKEQQRAERVTIEKQENLCSQMESLSDSAYSTQFNGKYQHLRREWQGLSKEPDKHLIARFESADILCQDIIQQNQQEEQALLQQAEQLQQVQGQQQAICGKLELELAQIKQQEYTTEALIVEIDTLLETSNAGWQEAKLSTRPHPKEQLRYDKASRLLADFQVAAKKIVKEHSAIEKLLGKTSKQEHHTQFIHLETWLRQIEALTARIAWPDELMPPALLVELNRQKETLREQVSELKNQSSQIQQTVKKQLLDLEQKLEDGATESAKHLTNRIRNNLDKLSGNEAKSFERQYRTLQKRLTDFFDWQHYATDPKREGLCLEMEKLIEIAIPPPQKAHAIKALQEEWKNLGDSRHTQQLWQRFKKAADLAYAPCKEYFQGQGDLRNHNITQRQHICEQLHNYIEQTDWDNVDWKAVEQIFNLAKQEWRQFVPVDRTKAKSLQKSFDQKLDILRNKLKEERKNNAHNKEQLIAQAFALSELEDVREAIDQAKQLQHQWQDIGLTYRKENQQLWTKFREAIDQVFERRNHERESVQHEREDNLVQAKQLHQQIRKLADQNDETLSLSQPTFNDLKESFLNLGPIPKSQFNAIKKEFQDSCDYFQQRFSGIRNRQQQRALALLKEYAEHCDRLEALPTEAEEERTALQQHWQKPAELPNQWWERIDARFQRSKLANKQELLAENQAALRILCIRLEILTDLETPAEDQAKRMEYQMARLSKGLGQTNNSNHQQEIDELEVQWLCTGPNEPSVFPQLKSRFQAAMDKVV